MGFCFYCLKRLCGLVLLAVLTTGCHESYISARTAYLSHENLASFIVNTPDPLLNCPPVGQRLIIDWSVPKTYLRLEELHLNVTIRFRNRNQISFSLPLQQRKGTYVYSVLNEDYFTTRGILTYKIDLLSGDCVLEEWRHQIWTELITIQKEEEKEEEEDRKEEEREQQSDQPQRSDFYEDFE